MVNNHSNRFRPLRIGLFPLQMSVSWLTSPSWRLIPVSKWLVTPIYKPFSPFGREITLLRGFTNHGHGYLPHTNCDDPPSTGRFGRRPGKIFWSIQWRGGAGGDGLKFVTVIYNGSGQIIATSNGGSVREIPLGKSRLVKCYILARRIC